MTKMTKITKMNMTQINMKIMNMQIVNTIMQTQKCKINYSYKN
jgi:hypothetical protein